VKNATAYGEMGDLKDKLAQQKLYVGDESVARWTLGADSLVVNG
jgi:hypothetical protein